MMASPGGSAPEEPAQQASDVMAFGQEVGRVLSNGQVIGRAEPFAKVFPSSRVVKRAVGLVAWAILEDIALDARIDDAGRLVSETNVRRIAANLAISKNTVTQHLTRLRQHGFVLREELRQEGSGRYDLSRYVLDPSACIERFTVTPRAEDGVGQPTSGPWARPAWAGSAGDNNNNKGARAPRPRNWDAGTVSQSTGHRELGHNKKEDVVEENKHLRGGASVGAQTALIQQLIGIGVVPDVARSLVACQPPQRVAAAVRAADRAGVRNPSGFVVSALRGGWDLPDQMAEQRVAEQRERRNAEQALADANARADRARQRDQAEGWAAAISAALDDHALARAVASVTQPVAGLGRRSLPVIRAELVRWAATVAHRAPTAPFRKALLDDLARGPTRPSDGDVDLADPPTPQSPLSADLSARIAAWLAAHELPSPSSERGLAL
jgi:DNA-binding transcriptional ArsR family regulator